MRVPPPDASPGGALTWKAEDGRGFSEDHEILSEEGEEAEEQQAACDSQEGQNGPELNVHDDLSRKKQNWQAVNPIDSAASSGIESRNRQPPLPRAARVAFNLGEFSQAFDTAGGTGPCARPWPNSWPVNSPADCQGSS